MQVRYLAPAPQPSFAAAMLSSMNGHGAKLAALEVWSWCWSAALECGQARAGCDHVGKVRPRRVQQVISGYL